MPSVLDQMAEEAYQDHLKFLETAREQCPDGVYREGTPEFDNLTEAYVSMGIATGIKFAATIPAESQSDGGVTK